MSTTEYFRDQAGKAQREARYQRKRAERFESENTKLRKLVLDWSRLYREHERMSFKDSLGTEVVLFQRMQELGVMGE